MSFVKTQDKDGGYCPKCDTVWAAPGKCRCELSRMSKAVFDSSNANMGQTRKGYAVNNMYAKEIWNEAIEAAALLVDQESKIAYNIRKLKK